MRLIYLALYLVMESLGDRQLALVDNGHTVFQNGGAILPSYQQCLRVPVAPCPC